jgi:aminopeptidase S
MMKRTIQMIAIAVALSAAAFGQAKAPALNSKPYADDVAAITSGADAAARGKSIEGALKAAGVQYTAEPFTATIRGGNEVKGTNYVATIAATGISKRTIMIGAHLDRVAKGVGAIDNASGSAAVLELVRALKAKPLANVTVMAGFWDQEEVGLVGSRVFLQSREKTQLPAMYINFDVYGAGNTIWLWANDDKLTFPTSFLKAAKDNKFKYHVSKEYPPSDHRSFAAAGIESYSFSLGPAGEAKLMVDMLRGMGDPTMPPKVMQIIHTDKDTLDKVDADDVVKSLVVVEAAIRALDN